MACYRITSILINSIHSLDDNKLVVPFVEGVYTNGYSVSMNEKPAFNSLSSEGVIADSGFSF